MMNEGECVSWMQKQIRLKPHPRGFHLITSEVVHAMPELSMTKTGLLHVFVNHTSASLTINENADPDVRRDLEMAINRIVPDSLPYVHTAEGRDDMPAHVKASLFGHAVSVPVRDGSLALGTWQGIYLGEHRDHGGARTLTLTLWGE
jgi:secondary thiamine-phosphate synthase enzyme